MIVAMVVGRYRPPAGVILGASVVGPARKCVALCGRLSAAGHDRWLPDAAILRQLLIALAMIMDVAASAWPVASPEHGKSLTQKT